MNKLKGFVPLKNYENTHLINKDTKEIYSLLKHKKLKGSFKDGYKVFSLKDKDGIVRLKTLHRLIMETFVENPNNYPVINHIDGDKLNNNINNLEWCTISHNNKEAYRLGLRKVSDKTRKQFIKNCITPEAKQRGIENLKKHKEKAIKKSVETNSKPIAIYNNNSYYEFESEKKASNFLNVHKGSVGRVANGKVKTIKGFNAKYLEEE